MFRTAEDRLTYLAKDTVSRYDWSTSADVAMAIGEIVSFAESRGRVPVFEEIPDETLALIGHLSRAEISGLVRKGADPRPNRVRRETCNSQCSAVPRNLDLHRTPPTTRNFQFRSGKISASTFAAIETRAHGQTDFFSNFVMIHTFVAQ